MRKMRREGRSRDLYSMARIYAGKRRPAGILFLTDRQGNPLDSPEARMHEWTRECKQRFSPHVPVDYDLSLIHISEPTRPERIGVGGVGV